MQGFSYSVHPPPSPPTPLYIKVGDLVNMDYTGTIDESSTVGTVGSVFDTTVHDAGSNTGENKFKINVGTGMYLI